MLVAALPLGSAPKSDKSESKSDEPRPVAAMIGTLAKARSRLAEERSALAEAEAVLDKAQARVVKAKSAVRKQEVKLGAAVKRAESDLAALKKALATEVVVRKPKGRFKGKGDKGEKGETPNETADRVAKADKAERHEPLRIDSQAEPEKGPRLDDKMVEKVLQERRKRRAIEEAAKDGDEQKDKHEPTTLLRLLVPGSAKVWLNGKLQQGSGKVREFEGTWLKKGKSNTYQVRVAWRDGNGKKHQKRKRVKVEAGETKEVRIGR
jgi:uncharacterized protein (TIGR03000 family)